MPRLLILCEYPTLLGGERSMLATLGTVAAAGFEILVAAPPSGPLAEAIRDSSFATHVPWRIHDDSGTRLPLAQLRSSLRKTITTVRPDLIHANSLSTARIAGPVAADCRIASIGHLRDIVKLAPQAVQDLNTHRRLLAVSAATRDYHIAQGLAASRCFVVYNGVDLTQFRPRPRSGYLHQELGLPASARLVAVVGQLGLRKGTDTALAAAALVAQQMPDAGELQSRSSGPYFGQPAASFPAIAGRKHGPDPFAFDFAVLPMPAVHWLIVGERTSQKDESRLFEERLRTLASQPPLADRVHFLGTRDDMPTLLNECELLVHAARQEPLGRVLLESAACGLAIIATDVGGTREIFPAGEAILVRTDDADQLAGKIVEVFGSSFKTGSWEGEAPAEPPLVRPDGTDQLAEKVVKVLGSSFKTGPWEGEAPAEPPRASVSLGGSLALPAFETASSDSQRQAALQAAARARAEQAFDIEHAAQRLVEHYLQTLSNPV